MSLLLIYYIVTNVVAFLLFWRDKRQAERGKWRISERALLTWSFLGGALGAYLAMRIFRHKTQKPVFRLGVPIAILVHAAITAFFIF